MDPRRGPREHPVVDRSGWHRANPDGKLVRIGYFLLNLLLFGITSGASIFGAQYWGQRDLPNIRRVLGLSLTLCISASAVFTLITLVFPEAALGIYSRDPAVIALGRTYLRISGASCFFMAVSYCYAAMLRSVGEVRTPMFINVLALAINLTLSYSLVFGKLGLPHLGATGAAYGLGISRLLACIAMLAAVYWRKMPVAATLREMTSFDRRLAGAVLRRLVPVAINEMLWSLGITAYNVIFARLGTDALAALNVIGPIENLAFVPFVGLGGACAILVGHEIGAGNRADAFRYGGLLAGLTIVSAVVVGLLVWLIGRQVLAFYQVSAQAMDYAQKLLVFLALGVWSRAANLTLFIGILRAGGDTRFALVLDAGSIWGVGVTLAALAAFVLHWPAPLVYLVTFADELFKLSVVTGRFFSGKWIHHVTQVAA